MNDEKICCPRFDPTPWDGKTFEWASKKFIKDKVFTLFYMPMNFGSAMIRSVKKIEEAGAEMLEGMVLSEHTMPKTRGYRSKKYICGIPLAPSAQKDTARIMLLLPDK